MQYLRHHLQKGKRMQYADYYAQRCKVASIEQGIDGLVDELNRIGITATSEQTGGFTMCAYIEITPKRYIYANLYGAGIYDKEGFIEDLIQFDDKQETKTIAEAIANYAKKEAN